MCRSGNHSRRRRQPVASGQEPRGSLEVMREFPYGAVRLTGGPIKQHFDRIHAHYLALDNDRLLKVFRQRAGLPAPGPDMGGWYDTDGFVPGLTLGQYISGLARFGAATGEGRRTTKSRGWSQVSASSSGAPRVRTPGQMRRRSGPPTSWTSTSSGSSTRFS